MNKILKVSIIALLTFWAAGIIYDNITGAAQNLGAELTGAFFDEQTVHIAGKIAWDFSVVRFFCQALMSAGVTAGFFLKHQK